MSYDAREGVFHHDLHTLPTQLQKNTQCMRRTTCRSYCRPDVVSKFMLRWSRMPLREGNCTVTCTASVISLFLTRCVHFTPGCTTGWVNMQMSPAKRRLSGPARTLMTSLGWRAQQGGCVDSRRCGEFGRNLKKERILIYLFIFTLGSTWSCGKRTIGSITNIHKTLLYSIYSVIIWIFKTFCPAGCRTGCATACTTGCKV